MVAIEPEIMTADSTPKGVIKFIEAEMAKCKEKTRLLRLICLLSLTCYGLHDDVYDLLRKEFIDAFGISELLRILNLERVGILKKKKGSASEWRNLRKVIK